MTICCIIKRCLVMFLRGGKVNFVEYYEQVITFHMAQLLKTRNINVVPGQLFSCQCKAKFLLETDSLYWLSRCISIHYRYWQWIHWMSNTNEKTPMKKLTRIYENFKEKYFSSIQSTSWKIESLILIIKMIWRRKWITCLCYTRQWKKNQKQHHIQNKSKFLHWYLINGLECTVQNILMSLNTLLELQMKPKR